MKAVTFDLSNLVLAEDQDEFNNLPVYVPGLKEMDGKKCIDMNINPQGEYIACFELETPEEREEFLKTGRLYIGQLTGMGNYRPINVSVFQPENKDVIEEDLSGGDNGEA